MKIYDVQSGPWDDGEYIWNVSKVEKNGKVFDTELYFDTYDDAYKLVKYFSKNIEPIDFEPDDEEEDNE